MSAAEEPTDWQQLYKTGETPWDRGGPAPPLVEWLQTHQVHGTVLVPGCGPGHDLIPLAQNDSEARIIGLDVAPAAVSTAAQRTKHLPNITLLCGDLFVECHGALRGQCDWVFEHTCFCALLPRLRPDYAAAIADALKPRGRLVAIFYLNPWEPGEDQSGGPPFGVTRSELDALFQPYFTVLESWQPAVAYPGRERREEMRLLERR